jgi:iron complex outermembrane recepter protein
MKLRSAVTVCLLAAGLDSAFATVSAQSASETAPRPLDAALQSFARQSGLQLIYVSDATRGRTTRGSGAGATVEEALTNLLAGTGLSFEFLNERTVEIRSPRRPFRSARALTLARATTNADATQEGSTSQQAAASAALEQVTLDEVVVTARKREERLIDVPVAVTAFSGDALERRGAVTLGDFLQEAPGVNIYDNGRGYKISIRGVSTSLGANENGYYLDELPFTGVTVPLNPDVRAWDLQRVEVLRGPQGTLFGEGSMGGTVRILTRDPEFNEWQAQGLIGGSDTSGGGTNRGYKAMVNIPLVDDRLALRLAGTQEKYDGWLDDSVIRAKDINEQDITTYRAKVRFRPTDRLTFAASYWHFDGEYPRDNTADDQGFAGTGLALAARSEYNLYGATIDYDLGPLRAFYSYANNAFELPRSGSLFGGTLVSDIDIDVRSHELRFSSTAQGPWQWTVGAYRREAERQENFVFALFGIDNGSATDATSQALFGEATYSLAQVPIDLTLGLRSVREELEGLETNAGIAGLPVDATYKSTNPRAIVAWRPTQNWRLYASAAKGYRSGQLQSSVSRALAGPLGISLPPTLQDDSIWSYELGTKASLADGRAILEAAVYHSKWEDVTVRIPIGATGFNGLINSEGTDTNGIEASVTLQLTSAWRLNVGASYADATYAGDVPGTGIRDGRPVDEHAKTTASASVDYGRNVYGALRGSARLGVQYYSARDYPSFGPPLYLPGDSITTLAARFGVEGEQWGAFLYGDNLTNEDGAISARNVVTPGVTPAIANRLRPRTVGVEVRYNFAKAE